MTFSKIGQAPDPFLQQLARQFLENGSDAFDERVELYRQDPVFYFTDRLGIPEGTIRWSLASPSRYIDHEWDGDKDPFVQASEALRDGKDVAIESATATGKTFYGALIVLWWLECWENSQVVTIAPKADQLKLHLWKELARIWPKLQPLYPRASLTTLKLRMRGGTDETWTATGFPVQARAGEDAATRAQGFHAERLLFITEETPGIDPPVMRAIENTCTAPFNLILSLGNPDHKLDTLHGRVETPGVVSIRISALDHPNLVLDDAGYIPGAVSWKSVKERATRYGENSKLYKSRVRGICPDQSADALIKLEWIRVCQQDAKRDELLAQRNASWHPALGVDVAASENGDMGAYCWGDGPICEGILDEPCPDPNIFGAKMVSFAKANKIPARRCGIDVIGVGAGAYGEMKRQQYLANALASQGAPKHDPTSEETFLNLRAQMWWKARMDIQYGKVFLPRDEELVQDLVSVEWTVYNGKIKIKSKQEIKNDLGRSPNKGDAWVYWNWARENLASVSGFADVITL